MNVSALEAVAVTAGTLALIVIRPRGLNEGLAALIGAAAALVLGLVPLAEAGRQEAAQWNIFLFFLGMMGVAALADQSGVFDRVGHSVARRAGGSVRTLYIAVFLLGAGISLLFANDTTALVLTPIVYALVMRLRLDPLPFVFATTFVADTASVGLPVSNPLNVILSDGFGLGLGAYVTHLWLPALAVIAVNLLVFLLLFRRGIRGRYRRPSAAPPHPVAPTTFVLLGALACAYLVASALRFPLGLVALAGAALMVLDLRRQGRLAPRRLLDDIGWPIFGFIAGMVIVVQGLSDSGVTAAFGRVLVHLGSGNALATITAGTVGTAVGANVINNLPMAFVMVGAVHGVHTAAPLRLDLIYATVLGCDLGPNLTHLGSLATFIWLFFLRRKGLNVSALDYARVGLLVTPFLLAAAILSLWATSF